MSKLKISYHDNLLVNTTNSGTYNLATADKLMIDNIKFELGDTQLQEKTIKASTDNITVLPVDPYEGFSKVTIEHPDLYEGATKLNDFETSEWWDSFASMSAPKGNVILSDDITTISSWSFRGRKNITSITSTNLSSIPGNAFWGCTKLKTINFPNVTKCNGSSFRECKGLTDIILPKVTSIGQNEFYSCYGIKSMYLPNCTTMGNNACDGVGKQISDGIYVFPKITAISNSGLRSMGKNATIDLGPDCASLGTYAIYQYSSDVKNLILRKTDTVVTATANTSITNIGASTKVYVPQALIEDYKNATNWSTKGEVFYPIEGSEFEHYYANGVAIEEGE